MLVTGIPAAAHPRGACPRKRWSAWPVVTWRLVWLFGCLSGAWLGLWSGFLVVSYGVSWCLSVTGRMTRLRLVRCGLRCRRRLQLSSQGAQTDVTSSTVAVATIVPIVTQSELTSQLAHQPVQETIFGRQTPGQVGVAGLVRNEAKRRREPQPASVCQPASLGPAELPTNTPATGTVGVLMPTRTTQNARLGCLARRLCWFSAVQARI